MVDVFICFLLTTTSIKHRAQLLLCNWPIKKLVHVFNKWIEKLVHVVANQKISLCYDTVVFFR